MQVFQALSDYPVFFYLSVLTIGAVVGSFLNVVIYRLPLMMQREWRSECRVLLEQATDSEDEKAFNLATPSSHCPHCNTVIKPWQNIPVFSYLLLRGRCGHCRQPISLRYALVEFSCAALSLLAAYQLGATPQLLAALILSWALLTLSLIDADHQLLPDQITLPLLWLGLLLNSQGLFVSLPEAVWGAALGYLSLWLVFWGFKLFTGKEGMGYGDFKLLAALGAWMGWQALPMIILLSSLVGAVLGIIMLSIKRQGRNTTLPFGPYLAGAGWLALLWGEPIKQFYFQLAGIH